jgi:hypothetical protein
VARKRFTSRGRAADVFEKRFDDYIESIEPIVAAMEKDNVRVVEYSTDQLRLSSCEHVTINGTLRYYF